MLCPVELRVHSVEGSINLTVCGTIIKTCLRGDVLRQDAYGANYSWFNGQPESHRFNLFFLKKSAENIRTLLALTQANPILKCVQVQAFVPVVLQKCR